MKIFFKKLKIKNKKGLSLIELIVAIAVLSITVLAATAVSATYLKNRTSIKKYQANNEELSLALNFMSKDIRMSNCGENDSECALGNGGNTDTITVKSSRTEKLITYRFNNDGNLTRQVDGEEAAVMIGDVTGKFYVTDNDIKRITIRIEKTATASVPAMTVQTTVSMRSGYNDEVQP